MDSLARQMIRVIKEKYGLNAPKVFSAMLRVGREEFVSFSLRDRAYEDSALAIEKGQTISQPYTIAFMTSLLFMDGKSHFAEASRDWRVLEIGTGSGYQAAILSHLAKEVYSIERISELARSAKERLKKLDIKNVFVKVGNGEEGWKQKSPYDAILITAGVSGEVPSKLFNQLKIGGVLVAPIGESGDKTMTKFIKKKARIEKQEFPGRFSFVPFVAKI